MSEGQEKQPPAEEVPKEEPQVVKEGQPVVTEEAKIQEDEPPKDEDQSAVKQNNEEGKDDAKEETDNKQDETELKQEEIQDKQEVTENNQEEGDKQQDSENKQEEAEDKKQTEENQDEGENKPEEAENKPEEGENKPEEGEIKPEEAEGNKEDTDNKEADQQVEQELQQTEDQEETVQIEDNQEQSPQQEDDIVQQEENKDTLHTEEKHTLESNEDEPRIEDVQVDQDGNEPNRIQISPPEEQSLSPEEGDEYYPEGDYQEGEYPDGDYPDGEQFNDEEYENGLLEDDMDHQEVDEEQLLREEQQIEETIPDQDQIIQEKIAMIISLCKENDAKYGDSDFPPNDASLYKDPTNPPDYAKETPIVEWRRPEEMSDEPMMMKDGASPGDVKQGMLGDCWLLGSFCVLATHSELLQNLLVYDGIDYGFAVFQFFKNGEWQHVIVDTRIPYNNQTKAPLYSHCADPNEFWVPLIEKAYSKLHQNYEELNGGSMAVAMVDLTAGISEKHNMKSPETIEQIEKGTMWKDMKRYHTQGFIIGCANTVKDTDGQQEEGVGNNGIINNHAYGIMDIRDIDGLQLIRIRNPWGHSEWTGRFADEDEAWDDFKGLKEKLNYHFKDDGTWWMRYDDWCANYTKIYVCKIFSSAWQQYSIAGEWKGVTAGGAHPPIVELTEEERESNVQNDTNDRWFNNPQYRISVTKKTKIYISLMQSDEKITKLNYIPVNFLVVRVRSKRDRLWQIDSRGNIVIEAADGIQRFAQREITQQCVLEPIHDKKPCHYIIIPNTETENKKDEDRPFWLRIFSSDVIDLAVLPPNIELVQQGRWQENTAGGKRTTETGADNQYWCKNPQYFLNITKPTHMKIILRKKGNRRVKGIQVGLVVTKAFAPTVPPKTQIIKPGKETLAQKSLTQKVKQSDKFPEFIPPQLENLERKLQILNNEWYIESSYKNEDVASLYAFWQSTQGPFLIVPSLGKEDITSDFTLTIFSSQPVEVMKLEDSKNAVIPGRWTDKTAGGCHMYDKAFFENRTDKYTFQSNPKFHLKLNLANPNELTLVKIVLSRPDKVWKKQIAKSAVSCMIGFYIYEGNAIQNKENAKNEFKFVPMNEISEELNLGAHPDGYIIMPSTYDPGKIGPFILSVATDVDFSLIALE